MSECLEIIHKYLFKDAEIPKGFPQVWEMSPSLALLDTSVGPNKRGQFQPDTNEVMLVTGLWCVSTPIHETLHAVSSFQQLEEALAIKPLFEGLTECLTGYLLYKAYPYTYSNCWNVTDKGSRCSISPYYRSNCKLWGAFFHFVPISTITSFYDKSRPDWKTMCSSFADAIRNNGYEHFRDVLGNVLSSNVPITDQTFQDECQIVFKNKFTMFTRTSVALDFSNIVK